MKRIAGSLVVVMALCVAGVAHAEDNGAKEKLAKKVVAQTFSHEQWQKLAGALDAQLATQLGPDASKEEIDAMKIESFLSYQDLADFELGLLMKYYNADELRSLSAFYATPAGQKTLKVQPELAQDINGFVMNRLQEQMPKVMEKVRAIRAKHQQSQQGQQTP